MKTLYVTDLDGTLLNEKAELSEYTTAALNRLLAQGIAISLATARTEATVLKMFQSVSLTIPIILMNGVVIYDPATATYLRIESILQPSVINLLQSLQEQQLTGFLYSMENGKLLIQYENLDNPLSREFHDERVRKYDKKFTKVRSFFDCIDQTVIYFSVCDRKEILQPLYEAISLDRHLHIEFYRDIYKENFWYLEVCSALASKYNAVQFLRQYKNYEEVVSFGDNWNDISMFKASNRSYAVANAKEEVKAYATMVIGKNTEDSVIKQIERDAQ